MRVTCEQQHLVVLGDFSQDFGGVLGALGIEVDQDVVEDEGERFGTFCEGFGKSDPQAQVELFDAAAT
jgi:hypothetical protein